MPFFLESTSGNAVPSASWFDSGYTFTFSTCIASGSHLLGACCLESTVLGFFGRRLLWFACDWTVGAYDHFARGPAWLFDSLDNSTESVV